MTDWQKRQHRKLPNKHGGSTVCISHVFVINLVKEKKIYRRVVFISSADREIIRWTRNFQFFLLFIDRWKKEVLKTKNFAKGSKSIPETIINSHLATWLSCFWLRWGGRGGVEKSQVIVLIFSPPLKPHAISHNL